LGSFRSSQQQTERLENCAFPASVLAQERHPRIASLAAAKPKGDRWKAAYILNREFFHPHVFASARKSIVTERRRKETGGLLALNRGDGLAYTLMVERVRKPVAMPGAQ
jgi:hypothetical protein